MSQKNEFQQTQVLNTLMGPTQEFQMASQNAENAKKFKIATISAMMGTIFGVAGAIYGIKGDWFKYYDPTDPSYYYLYGVNKWTVCQKGECRASKSTACEFIQDDANEYYNDPSDAGNFCDLDKALPGLVYTNIVFSIITFLIVVYIAKEGHINTARSTFYSGAVFSILSFIFGIVLVGVSAGLFTIPEFKKHDDVKASPEISFHCNVVSTVAFLASAIILIIRARRQPVNGGPKPEQTATGGPVAVSVYSAPATQQASVATVYTAHATRPADGSKSATMTTNSYVQPTYAQPQSQVYGAQQQNQFAYPPAAAVARGQYYAPQGQVQQQNQYQQQTQYQTRGY
ncbi:hypothetical protein HDU97_001195 [Phlyctochytrium planicorne]|nr:hypothetical protein HDU97_001195 [Phlyctochytrium planicorne]